MMLWRSPITRRGPWAVDFVAVVLNRLEVRRDGKAAYRRLKGKKYSMPGKESGEGVRRKPDNSTGALGKNCPAHGRLKFMLARYPNLASLLWPRKMEFGKRDGFSWD